ncbi:MAG TPA: hypothetical protein VKC59_07220, partial [Candidatus Limnocylindrales bacterium]|nr:hypothetical protein [Candidatus Limnocylindrales bacterium]
RCRPGPGRSISIWIPLGGLPFTPTGYDTWPTAGSLAEHLVQGVACAEIVRFHTPAKVNWIPADPPNPETEIGRSPAKDVASESRQSHFHYARSSESGS